MDLALSPLRFLHPQGKTLAAISAFLRACSRLACALRLSALILGGGPPASWPASLPLCFELITRADFKLAIASSSISSVLATLSKIAACASPCGWTRLFCEAALRTPCRPSWPSSFDLLGSCMRESEGGPCPSTQASRR